MKTVKTFILRLLMDSDRSADLCGSLLPVASETAFHFKNEQALLELLRYHNLVRMDEKKVTTPGKEKPDDVSFPELPDDRGEKE